MSRPVLRYHGGKWILAEWIIKHFPPHRTYVEPFGGAASVLIQKPRSYAEVYNDLDGEVVNLFRVLRDPATAAELERALRLTPFARDEFVLSYEPCSDPLERARRSVVRSFMGFGSAAATGRVSGFRANSNRSGTTPAHDWVNYPNSVGGFVERLAGVVIENRPAVGIMLQHDSPATLHYVDPPYPHVTRAVGAAAKSYRHELTDAEHTELAAALHSLSGMVILSGYPCDLYDRELYRDWKRVERDALADGARPRTEVLWMNDAAVAAHSLPLFDVA
jgi:DNA adenine methylase